MNEVPSTLKEIYSALSEDGQKLLLSMAIPDKFGMKKDALLVVAGLPEEKLDRAISELQSYRFLEIGKKEDREFVIGTGDRYRLVPGLSEKVLKDVLNM